RDRIQQAIETQQVASCNYVDDNRRRSTIEILSLAFNCKADVYLSRLSTENLRSEEHTSELQSREYIVCRLLLEKKKKNICIPKPSAKSKDITYLYVEQRFYHLNDTKTQLTHNKITINISKN